MANNRLYFAISQVGIKGDGVTNFNALHGVQSLGITTTFNLEPVQALGQLALYENVEEIPLVEVTMNKLLDGHPLIFHEATIQASLPTLPGRSTSKCLIAVAYFDETLQSAQGTPASQVQVSGAFITSVSYNLPLAGNYNEEVTFQANDKVWANDPLMLQAAPWTNAKTLVFTGAFSSNDDAPTGSGGVNRRQDLLFAHKGAVVGLDVNNMVADPDATILPPEVRGISSSGTNEWGNGMYTAHIGDITVSVDLSRDPIQEQGTRGPYARTVNFPVQVTCEINATAVSGDMISATTAGILTTSTAQCAAGGNLRDRTIRLAICEGTRIYLGTKNKLQSVNQTGGDAGGGNVTVTYSFATQNDLTVLHSNDPNSNGSTWWTNRDTYLVDA
jgi:hypothetical protein